VGLVPRASRASLLRADLVAIWQGDSRLAKGFSRRPTQSDWPSHADVYRNELGPGQGLCQGRDGLASPPVFPISGQNYSKEVTGPHT
jgi:hypothetical protein